MHLIDLYKSKHSNGQPGPIKKKMVKFFLLSFLYLLMVVHGVAQKNPHYGDTALFGQLESFDIEEGDEIESCEIPSWSRSEHSGKNVVNVDAFGAVGDGVSDDTKVNS